MAGLITRIGAAWHALSGVEVKSTVGGPFEQILALLSQSRMTKSGTVVNVDRALEVATVLACTRVIAEGVAVMPWKLQRRFDDGRREFARDMPLYKILYRRPNDWQTAFEYREQLMYHSALTGNAYSFITRDGMKRITELIPITPTRVKVVQDADLNIEYHVRDAGGQILRVPREDILHIRGPSWDSVRGLDIVHMAREAIGLAIATEESHAHLHKHGLQTSGIISFDEALSQDARERLKARIKEMKAEDDHGILILDRAAKFTSMVMSGVDAQHLESRRVQMEEICRILRVFPQMIGLSGGTSHGSVEQFFMAHLVHTLSPWVERLEQAVDRDCISEEDEQGDFELVAKMSIQGMLRGDAAARAAFYASGIVNGWMTRADAREFEDMPALVGQGLEKILTPLNMISGGPGGTDGQAPVQRRNPLGNEAAQAKMLARMVAEEMVTEAGHGEVAAIEAKVAAALSAISEDHARRHLADAFETLER